MTANGGTSALATPLASTPKHLEVHGMLAGRVAPVEVAHQQILAGRHARRHNRKYAIVQKHLWKLQERYDNGQLTAIEYITSGSYKFAERH